MRNSNYLLIAAACAAISLAGPAAAKTSVITQPSPALAAGSTFAWAPTRGVAYGAPGSMVANQIAETNLRLATERTLAARSYRQVPNPAQADLLVSYTVVILPRSETRISGFGCGIRFCRAPASYNVDTNHYTDGSLVLDLVDRRTGRLVWRASSEKRVNANDVTPEKLAGLLGQMTKSLPQR